MVSMERRNTRWRGCMRSLLSLSSKQTRVDKIKTFLNSFRSFPVHPKCDRYLVRWQGQFCVDNGIDSTRLDSRRPTPTPTCKVLSKRRRILLPAHRKQQEGFLKAPKSFLGLRETLLHGCWAVCAFHVHVFELMIRIQHTDSRYCTTSPLLVNS